MAKKYEDCDDEEQRGWREGIHSYLWDTSLLSVETTEAFMQVFRKKLKPGQSEDYYAGALMGINAENGAE